MPVRRVAPLLLLAVLLAACAGPSAPVAGITSSGLDDDVMARFSDAMSQSIGAQRAERDGTDLVIVSETCVLRIPVTEDATPDGFFLPLPPSGGVFRMRITSAGTRVACEGRAPTVQERSSFGFRSEADRDRAIQTGRTLLVLWPPGAFAPLADAASPRPDPPTSAAPDSTDAPPPDFSFGGGDPLFGLGSGLGFDQPGLGFAYRLTEAGLVVTALADDGPGVGAGLLEDDLVTSVAGHAMAGLSRDAIQGRMAVVSYVGAPVVLDVQRGGRRTRVTITPAPYSRAALREKVRARTEASDRPPAPASGGTPPVADVPAPGPGCISGTCTTGRGTWRYPSGATYTGDLRDGVRHGRGTFTWPSGRTFVGDWVDGARVRGREEYDSGDTYDGEYANDKPHGQGTKRYTDGSSYAGAWQDGARNGQGTNTWPSGQRFVGEWADNQPVHGTLRLASGHEFEGPYASGDAFDGDGYALMTGGAVYQGTWRGGDPHGTGTMLYENLGRYTGAWDDGLREGEGTMLYANGDIFIGTWANDRPVAGMLDTPDDVLRPARYENGRFVYVDE